MTVLFSVAQCQANSISNHGEDAAPQSARSSEKGARVFGPGFMLKRSGPRRVASRLD